MNMKRTALVTGASRGIGAAISERLAAEGNNVILHYFLSEESVKQVAENCAKYGIKVQTISADLRKPEEVRSLIRQLHESPLSVDYFIHNAGTSHFGLIQDLAEKEWDDLFHIHVKSAFLLIQHLIPHLIRQQFGRIVTVSSVWGMTGAACEAAYSAAKGGLIALTKSLAKELAGTAITVNTVAPGAVETEMNRHLSEEEKNAVVTDIPMGRFGTPEEVASAVNYLCSEEAGYITGQILSPNGGWFM